ncbi:MAG: helix-turn-helix domain-containing protein [Planctomycetota bacterium]
MVAGNADRPARVEKWYRVTEAMEITGFSRSFIYSQMDQGKLRSIKAGGGRRIPDSALAEFQRRFDGNGEIEVSDSHQGAPAC